MTNPSTPSDSFGLETLSWGRPLSILADFPPVGLVA